MRLIRYNLVYINTAHGGAFLAVFLLANAATKKGFANARDPKLIGPRTTDSQITVWQIKVGIRYLAPFCAEYPSNAAHSRFLAKVRKY